MTVVIIHFVYLVINQYLSVIRYIYISLFNESLNKF